MSSDKISATGEEDAVANDIQTAKTSRYGTFVAFMIG